MKKIIIICLFIFISFNGKANIIVEKNTNCEYTLSIPNYGYFSISPNTTMEFIQATLL